MCKISVLKVIFTFKMGRQAVTFGKNNNIFSSTFGFLGNITKLVLKAKYLTYSPYQNDVLTEIN